MNTKEKLIFCKEHGISLSYIASKAKIVPATLTKWIRNEKGISKKNLLTIEEVLQSFANEIYQVIGDNNDRNL